MLARVDQPGTDEEVTIAGNPIKTTETDPRLRGRTPLLDEHREELLGMPGTDGEDRQRAESDD